MDDVDVGDGTVGGDVVRWAADSKIAAAMALMILDGAKPQEIPVVRNDNACPHARRYQLTGRYAGHVYPAGSAVCIERAVERTRLCGLRRSTVDVATRRGRLAVYLRHTPGALRVDALHVRQPDGTDLGSLRRLSGRRRENWCSRTLNDFCPALCEQLFLDNYAAGRQPKRHLRRE